MIYGPKDDGTYVVEFRTAEGGWRCDKEAVRWPTTSMIMNDKSRRPVQHRALLLAFSGAFERSRY